MSTKIDVMQLIVDMEVTASQLMRLAGEMKDASARVLSGEIDDKSIEISSRRIAKPQAEFAAALLPSISFDGEKFASDLKKGISKAIGKDVDTLKDFARKQAKEVIAYATIVTKAIAKGEITRDMSEFALDALKAMVENLIQTLAGMMEIIIEEVLNAVIEVLSDTIKKAVGGMAPWLGALI